MTRPYVPGHGPTGTVDHPRYEEVEVQLTGEDGNAVAIIGAVSRALVRAARGDDTTVPHEAAEQFRAEAFASRSYDDLLNLVMCWVTVL